MWNIAVVSAHTCPLAHLGEKETGGMNVYIRETSRLLSRYGFKVDIFTRLQDPALPRIVELEKRARIIHLPAGPKSRYDKYLLGDNLDEFVDGIDAFSRTHGISYDLIHSHYWLSGWASIRLKRKWKVPMIHMYHTLGGITNMVVQRREEREKVVRIDKEHAIAEEADRIVASNPMERAQLAWFYKARPEKVSVIPCGVDLNLFRPYNREESRKAPGLDKRFSILYVGRIHPIKGIETLLKALSILVERFGFSRKEIGLLLIGGDPSENGGEMERLKAISKRLKINDIVRFQGAQRYEDLPAFYSAADVLVLPSRHESFGMVALEAMACGTPVIASKVGGLTYTVKDNRTGFHIPQGDAYAIFIVKSFRSTHRYPGKIRMKVYKVLIRETTRCRPGAEDVFRSRKALKQ
jgi:D-inositol-3-phosphate glycosyltransferase